MTKYFSGIAVAIFLSLVALAIYVYSNESGVPTVGVEGLNDFKVAEHKNESVVISLSDATKKNDQPQTPTKPEYTSKIDRKMERSLKLFKQKMGAIEPGSIAREREEIEALREESEARTIEPPTVEVVVDEYGNKMKKYTYENGIVRYGLM